MAEYIFKLNIQPLNFVDLSGEKVCVENVFRKAQFSEVWTSQFEGEQRAHSIFNNSQNVTCVETLVKELTREHVEEIAVVLAILRKLILVEIFSMKFSSLQLFGVWSSIGIELSSLEFERVLELVGQSVGNFSMKSKSEDSTA